MKLSISTTEEHRRLLKSFQNKRQTFEEFMLDRTNVRKEYIDLDFAVHFLCFNQPRATSEALRSLRAFYPEVNVHLVSDGGDDFSQIANRFGCDYTFEKENVHSPRGRKPFQYAKRVWQTCRMYRSSWIVLMEDDVRIRDRISKHPDAHIAGPSGPEYSKATIDYLKSKHPRLEINGYNGCGGCVFDRKAFLTAYRQIDEIETLASQLDHRIQYDADALLTFIFLNAGYTARRWLDHSEDLGLHRGPGSAFDHQFKAFYYQPMIPI